MQRTKVQKCKSAKRHGNEEQMNIAIYHMLQSCGSQAGSYPKTEVINETHLLALRELSWRGSLGFLSPKSDYHQWLKVHIFAIWEIQRSERIQHIGFIVKQSVT